MLPVKWVCRFVIACMLILPLSVIADDIVQIRFSTDEAVPFITPAGDKMVTVSFNDLQLKSIFSSYIIKSCVQSYPMVLNIPHSLSSVLNRVYEFTLAAGGTELMRQLDDYTGSSIVNKYLLSTPQELMLPNDYNSDVIPCGPAAQPLKHLELIDARGAWDITTGSAAIRIAILDNGFNKNHEDLVGKIANPATPTGLQAHGTAVAGQVAANTNNGIGHSAIGYNCQLLVYETGFKCFPQAMLAGAKVINCSWYSSCSFNQNEQDLIGIAHDLGVVVVAAAGNGGTCGAATNYVYPASYNHVLSVTGVGHYFSRSKADSCNGKINHEDVHLYRVNSTAPYQTLQHNDKVDLAAPAYEVRSLSLSSYWNVSGSSFASPIVAGICGLLFSLNNNFTPDEIEGILKCTALNLDKIPGNAPYAGLLGAGRVNAHYALLKAKSMLDKRPADIIWYYYNKRGNRISFDPGELYLHTLSGAITGNTIFVEAVSKIPGISFEWEFIKGGCSMQKSGNPVSFNLATECSPFWYTLVVHVRNKVAGACDTDASVSYREVAYLDENTGCWEPFKRNLQEVADESARDSAGIMLYPNPASSVVTIQVPGVSTVRKAAFLSTTGKVIKTIQLMGSKTQMDIRGMPGGVYFLGVDWDGVRVIQKMVITH